VPAEEVVPARSYAEFKRDLFRRRHASTVSFDSHAVARRGVDMGFPGFGPESLLDAMRFLADTAPEGERLTVYVVTDFSWFDPQAHLAQSHDSFASKAGYLLSPWTLAASLDLMRSSRTLAFTGWRKERIGRTCVVDRGAPAPAWRANGTLSGGRASGNSPAPHGFAWPRLSSLDAALAIAQTLRWRVVGRSALEPPWATYEHELSALFAKHGYRWRARRMSA
jgi:hypothetical protein